MSEIPRVSAKYTGTSSTGEPAGRTETCSETVVTVGTSCSTDYTRVVHVVIAATYTLVVPSEGTAVAGER